MRKHKQKYNNCPNKSAARMQTIIDPYRKLFGNDCVPGDRQVWSLCAQCSNEQGELLNGCELHQYLEEGFLRAHQFVGVEMNEHVAELNSRLELDSFDSPNFIHGDFLDAIRSACGDGSFKPDIINADLIQQPVLGMGLISDIMHYVSECVPSKVMLVANFVMKNPYNSNAVEYNGNDAIRILNETGIMRGKTNWSIHNSLCSKYGGTGRRSQTVMGTIIFVKDGES